MKTTFKDIAHHYLGTGLRCQIGLVEARLCGVNDEDGAFDNCSEWPQIYKYIDLTKAIPLLRPLSSLTDREIEILDGLHDFSHMNFDQIKINPLRYPFVIIQQLLKWHFNCFQLSEDQFIAI